MFKIKLYFILFILYYILVGCKSIEDLNDNTDIKTLNEDGSLILEEKNSELNSINQNNLTYISELEHELEREEEQISNLIVELDNKKKQNANLLSENDIFVLEIERLGIENKNLLAEVNEILEKSTFDVNETFILDEEYVNSLILEAIKKSSTFLVGTEGMDLDVDVKLEHDNGKEYYLVRNSDFSNIADLIVYAEEIYTKDAIQDLPLHFYLEKDNMLYAIMGDRGTSRDWTRDKPKLVDVKIKEKILVYDINAYNKFDPNYDNYITKSVELLFVNGIGWRVNTFISDL